MNTNRIIRFTLASAAAAMLVVAHAGAQDGSRGGGGGGGRGGGGGGGAGGGGGGGGGGRPPNIGRPPTPQPVAPPPFVRFPTGGLFGGVPSQAPSFGSTPNSVLPMPPANPGRQWPSRPPNSNRPDRPVGDWNGSGGWNNQRPPNDGNWSGGSRDCWNGWGQNGRDCWWNNCIPRLPYRSAFWPWIGNSWNYDPFGTVWSTSTTYDPFLMYGMVPQQQVQQTPPRELTTLEKGDLMLRYGDPARAAVFFEEYLAKNPDDAAATRSLAMALLDDRRMDQAVAVLMLAYQHQPQLARTPIDPDTLSGNLMNHRTRFTSVMTYANRVRTASAFFAATVMAQSEGRNDVARRLLDRAVAEGLEKSLAEEMRLAIAR